MPYNRMYPDPNRDPRGFDIMRDRNRGPGAPAEPIRPIIGRPDRAPGYIPNPPASRVTGGGGIPTAGRGALHIGDSRDTYPDPSRDPRGFDVMAEARRRERERAERERGGLASGLPGYRGRF